MSFARHPDRPALARLVYTQEPPRTTHQSAARILRTTSGRLFIGKKKTAKIRPFLDALQLLAQANKPRAPLDGPVCLLIHWAFRRPVCRRTKARAGLETPCSVKPDLDNAAKAVIDTLAKAGWFTNDSVVSTLLMTKTEGDYPRLDIEARDDA